MKLVSSSQYYDAEAELVKYYCNRAQIPLVEEKTDYEHLIKIGKVPLLVYNNRIYQKGEIMKLILNWNMDVKDEQKFSIFDTCYQLLQQIEQVMWSKGPIDYQYRNAYSPIFDPINKYYLLYKVYKANKQKLDDDKLSQKIQINLQILQHYMTIEPYSIFHKMIIFLLKSINYNIRYSKIYSIAHKLELREVIYKDFDVDVQQPPNLNDDQQQIENKKTQSSIYLRIGALCLMSYVIARGY